MKSPVEAHSESISFSSRSFTPYTPAHIHTRTEQTTEYSAISGHNQHEYSYSVRRKNGEGAGHWRRTGEHLDFGDARVQAAQVLEFAAHDVPRFGHVGAQVAERGVARRETLERPRERLDAHQRRHKARERQLLVQDAKVLHRDARAGARAARPGPVARAQASGDRGTLLRRGLRRRPGRASVPAGAPRSDQRIDRRRAGIAVGRVTTRERWPQFARGGCRTSRVTCKEKTTPVTN